MTPTPIALSMSLCDYVIIEESTGKASLIGCLSSLVVPTLPSPPRDFFLATDLTGGGGRGRVNVEITRPDTNDWNWQTQADVYFRDRLSVVRYIVRVTNCSFPVPGRYAAVLYVDGELVGQRTLEVTAGGG